MIKTINMFLFFSVQSVQNADFDATFSPVHFLRDKRGEIWASPLRLFTESRSSFSRHLTQVFFFFLGEEKRDVLIAEPISRSHA